MPSAQEARQLALDLGFPWAAGWAVADLAYVDAVRGDEEVARAHVNELEQLTNSTSPAVPAVMNRALGDARTRAGTPLGGARSVAGQHFARLPAIQPDARQRRARRYGGRRPRSALRRDGRAPIALHHMGGALPEPGPQCLLARCRALADEADAERRFAEAIGLVDALPPFDRARTQLLYGEWLRRAQTPERMRASNCALHLKPSNRLQRSPWAERACSELRASGEQRAARDASTRDQLTPQELRIADLAADRLTNAEIAAQLFLSPRTIDYHLRKVFAKLEIASRADLASVELGEAVSH